MKRRRLRMGGFDHALQQTDLTSGISAAHASVGSGGKRDGSGRSAQRDLPCLRLAGRTGSVSKHAGQPGPKLPRAKPSRAARRVSRYAGQPEPGSPGPKPSGATHLISRYAGQPGHKPSGPEPSGSAGCVSEYPD